jgi:glycosyltransferase involved in cell wall biosynthesis
VEDLVPAITRLFSEHDDLELIAFGTGIPPEKVRSFFPEHLRARINCISSRSDKETAAVFQRADVCLLPSLLEGSPLVLMEAMASGLPIVTTRICGMKDILAHERDALLISPRSPDEIVNSVERLINDPQMRCSLGVNAMQKVKAFTWEQCASHTLNVYLDLTATSRRFNTTAAPVRG